MDGFNYNPNYFSIKDILACKEKVPCITNVSFPGMGFLLPENDEEDIKEGTIINIPLWLAKILASRQMRYVTIDIPNCFKEKTRDVFEADPKIINLYSVNSYFYEFGLAFIKLNPREGDIIQELLTKVFRERFRKILAWAINGMKDPFQIQELDMSERKMLKCGQSANDALHEWFIKPEIKLKPAEGVINLRKRKLLEGDKAKQNMFHHSLA